MLKIGYFSHTNIAPSETFIYDLVDGLSKEVDLDITYVSGKTSPINTDLDVKVLATGYSEKYVIHAQRLFKLGQLKGDNGSAWKTWFNKTVAYRQLIKAKLEKFDVAFIDYATSAVLVMDYLNEKEIPYIVHVHGYDITSSIADLQYLHSLKKLFNSASYFVVASNYMRRRLILLGCNSEKIKVIRIGIKHIANTIPWHERILSPPSIVFLGRLTPKKQPIALLYAFKIVHDKFPEAKLSIIGDGVLKNEILDTIKHLGLSSAIKMYGALSRNQAFSILKHHWIYAQHSVTSINGDTEGFAVSLAEASLHELPVVSTIHNGIVENIVDGQTGFLVPEYDYEKMAERIIFLIENPEIAQRMGKAGKKHIEKLCDHQLRINAIKELMYAIS